MRTRITPNTDIFCVVIFQIEDKTKEKHNHDLIYYAKCPELSYTKDVLGKTSRRIIERIADHAGKDKQSHLLNQAVTRYHQHIHLDNMKIFDSSFYNNKLIRNNSQQN